MRHPSTESPDILEAAAAAGSFQTMLSAVEAAGLAPELRAGGPFTVFAPTDEAFARLPEGFLAEVLADREKLSALVGHHVVPGALTTGDLAERPSAPNLRGGRLALTTSPGVRVDGVNVLRSDIEARNGLIHVLESVLLPL
jgi:uncharacterized surface protein with fasciclin (FAS1) repeats